LIAFAHISFRLCRHVAALMLLSAVSYRIDQSGH
jgi:hypothetical protein